MAEPDLKKYEGVMKAEEKLSEAEERFELWRNTIGLFLGPLIGIIIYLLPMPALSEKAHILAAILSWIVIWWICEPVPIPISALLGAVLCVVFGVAAAKWRLPRLRIPSSISFWEALSWRRPWPSMDWINASPTPSCR